jgi:hypothetical protein
MVGIKEHYRKDMKNPIKLYVDISSVILLTIVTGLFIRFMLQIEDRKDFAKDHQIDVKKETIFFHIINTPNGKTIIIIDSTPDVDAWTWRYKDSVLKNSRTFTIPDLDLSRDSLVGKSFVVNLTQERANVAKYDTNISFYVPPAGGQMTLIDGPPATYSPDEIFVNTIVNFSDPANEVANSTWHIENVIKNGKKVTYSFSDTGEHTITLERTSSRPRTAIRPFVLKVKVRPRKLRKISQPPPPHDDREDLLVKFLTNCKYNHSFDITSSSYTYILNKVFNNNPDINCKIFKQGKQEDGMTFRQFAFKAATPNKVRKIYYVHILPQNGKYAASLEIGYE